MRLAPPTLAPITRCAYLHAGGNAGKENGSRQTRQAISEKMRASRIGGGGESIRSKIYDSMCRRRE
jgi:hypothetical protein